MADQKTSVPPVSLVIADVDGTLVNREKALTPLAENVVKGLHKAGIAFAITSGRPPEGMAMLIKPLALKTPIAGFNGGIFVTPEMRVIEKHVLTPKAARCAADIIQACGADIWVYTETEWQVRDPNGPHIEHEQSVVKFKARVVADFAPALEHAVKIVAVSDDHDIAEKCATMLRSELGTHASVTWSQVYYVDVTHQNANKGAVLDTLSRHFGIPHERIFTIGDMQNDTLMFAKSGISVAMGNATPEVKARAMFATDSNDNDGFAKAIETYVLQRVPAETGHH